MGFFKEFGQCKASSPANRKPVPAKTVDNFMNNNLVKCALNMRPRVKVTLEASVNICTLYAHRYLASQHVLNWIQYPPTVKWPEKPLIYSKDLSLVYCKYWCKYSNTLWFMVIRYRWCTLRYFQGTIMICTNTPNPFNFCFQFFWGVASGIEGRRGLYTKYWHFSFASVEHHYGLVSMET